MPIQEIQFITRNEQGYEGVYPINFYPDPEREAGRAALVATPGREN